MSLKIQNLEVSIENKKIIKGVSLEIKPGEIHAVMGPNGSGKSSLAYALMGNNKYRVSSEKSKAEIDGKDLLDLEPNERAKLGLFLAFQYPHEVPGLSVSNFLRHALNSVSGKSVSVADFRKDLEKKAKDLGLKKEFLSRSLNEGFSGGEKKKAEVLQMAILKPKYAILDETDSGLDIDSLKKIAENVSLIAKEENMGVLVITHYKRLLEYLKPDFVHVLIEGKITVSGGPEIADRLEDSGYGVFNGGNYE